MISCKAQFACCLVGSSLDPMNFFLFFIYFIEDVDLSKSIRSNFIIKSDVSLTHQAILVVQTHGIFTDSTVKFFLSQTKNKF